MGQSAVKRHTTNETLEDILAIMKSLDAIMLADFSVGHPTADRLLVRALRRAAPRDATQIIEDIIAAYNKVGKWYE